MSKASAAIRDSSAESLAIDARHPRPAGSPGASFR
jgi:hypothetical protein